MQEGFHWMFWWASKLSQSNPVAFAVTRGPVYKQCLHTKTVCTPIPSHTLVFIEEEHAVKMCRPPIYFKPCICTCAHTLNLQRLSCISPQILTQITPRTALRVRQHSPTSASKKPTKNIKTSARGNIFHTSWCSVLPVEVQRRSQVVNSKCGNVCQTIAAIGTLITLGFWYVEDSGQEMHTKPVHLLYTVYAWASLQNKVILNRLECSTEINTCTAWQKKSFVFL